MNRIKLFALAVLVAGGAATAAFALAERAAAPRGPTYHQGAAAARPAGRWEYGRFRYSPDNAAEWSWRSGNVKISGNPRKIYQTFEGPPRAVEGDIWFGEVVSLIGQQGWEAFEIQDYETGSEIWFKRLAP
jgi:hypothetical protein